MVLTGAFIEEDDNENPHDGERDVSVNAPRQRRGGTCPSVLRAKTEDNAEERQKVDNGGQCFFLCDVVAHPPDMVENHIKDGHGDGCNQFAHAQRKGVVFQPRCPKGKSSGNEMEGITKAQQDRHDAKEAILLLSLFSARHENAQCDDAGEIEYIE